MPVAGILADAAQQLGDGAVEGSGDRVGPAVFVVELGERGEGTEVRRIARTGLLERLEGALGVVGDLVEQARELEEPLRRSTGSAAWRTRSWCISTAISESPSST